MTTIVAGLVAFSAVLALPTQLANALIGTDQIANNAVTSPKIRDGEVRTQDIGNSAVTSGKIADGTVQAQDIADGVIPSGGGVQLNARIVSVSLSIAPGTNRGEALDCGTDIVTGGGFAAPPNVVIVQNIQLDTHRWGFSATNHNSDTVDVLARATCIALGP